MKFKHHSNVQAMNSLFLVSFLLVSMVFIGYQVDASDQSSNMVSETRSESEPSSSTEPSYVRRRRSPTSLGLGGGLPIVGGLFGKSLVT